MTDFEAADLESLQIEASGLDQELTDSLNEKIQEGGDIEVALPGITATGSGSVNFSEAATVLHGLVDDQL